MLTLYLEAVDEMAPPLPLGELVTGSDMDTYFTGTWMLLFLKYLDPATGKLVFAGVHTALAHNTIDDLAPVLRSRAGLPSSQRLVVFEEVEFSHFENNLRGTPENCNFVLRGGHGWLRSLTKEFVRKLKKGRGGGQAVVKRVGLGQNGAK